MSIRSVDMQVLVQKIGDVARVQQVQLQEGSNRQQEFLQGINQQTVENSTTIQETGQNSSRKVGDKEEKEKNPRKKAKKAGKKALEEKSDTEIFKDHYKGNNLDIKI